MEQERDREAILAEGDLAWSELVTALDAGPDRPLYGEGDEVWNSRDVYGHFAHYHEATAEALYKALAGDPNPWGSEPEDATNSRWKAGDAALDLASARRWAHESRAALRGLLCSLDAEQWRRFGTKWFTDDIDGGHYRGHLEYMRGRSEDKDARED